MNQQSFNATFVARKSRSLRNGEVPITLRITVGGQRAELSINRSVNPEMWVAAKGMSKGKSPADIELNRYLEIVRSKLFAIHAQMVAEGAVVTPDALKKRFLGKNETPKMFLEVFRENNAKYRARYELGDIAKGTLLRWERCATYFEEFLTLRAKSSDIHLKEITLPLVDEFELWLRKTKACGHNCAIRYICTIKKIMRDAFNYKWIDRDPFYGKTYTKKKTDRLHLTAGELDSIMALDLSQLPRIELVRDIFIFCCFTGLAFSDASSLTADMIAADADGELWIHKRREKTDELCSIPLLEIPRQILVKYRGHRKLIGSDRVLPMLSNQRCNSYLKEIADLARISKKLTTHVARHTFACLSLDNHVSIETIAKMLGHANIKTTQVYAKMQDKTISEDMIKMRRRYDKVIVS